MAHRHRVELLRPALARITASVAVGIWAYFSVAQRVGAAAATLIGWNVGSVALLALSWAIIFRADANSTRKLAGSEDPGRTLIYVVVLLTSVASLLAATVLVRSPSFLGPERKDALAVLGLVTVALAWATTHTAFTFRYARLYYRADSEGIGGVTLPGELPPTYFDFAYFAFTIGMCFQVSDVVVTSPQIRRTVFLHAVMSFAYNSVILAFVLNLVFGRAA